MVSIRYNTEMGTLWIIQMDQRQRISGLGLPSSSISFLWEHNKKWGVKLEITQTWNHKIQRKHDVLMISTIYKIIKKEDLLAIINNIIIYF